MKVLSRQNSVEFQENSQKALEFLSNFLSFSLKFCDNLDRIGSGKTTNSVDPIRSRGVKIGSRSDPDPEKSDLDPDRGSWIGDPVHHCQFWIKSPKFS